MYSDILLSPGWQWARLRVNRLFWRSSFIVSETQRRCGAEISMWTLVKGVGSRITSKVSGASGFQFAGSSTVPLIFRWLDLGEVECVAFTVRNWKSHRELTVPPQFLWHSFANWEFGNFDEITAELDTTTFVGVRTMNLIQRQTETINRSRVVSGVVMLKSIYQVPQSTFAFCSVRDFRDHCHAHSFSCIDCFLFQLPVDSLRALDGCFQSFACRCYEYCTHCRVVNLTKNHNKNQFVHPSMSSCFSQSVWTLFLERNTWVMLMLMLMILMSLFQFAALHRKELQLYSHHNMYNRDWNFSQVIHTQ